MLEQNKLDYEEIDLTEKPEELASLKIKTGWRTVPQIFFDGRLIGGFRELATLNSQGKLDVLKGKG